MGHVGKAHSFGSGNIVCAARWIRQHGGRGLGGVLSGNEGAASLVRRTADHSVGIELFHKHIKIKGISKHGVRDADCRKVLLAQEVISRKWVPRTRRGALERQVNDVPNPRPRCCFERILVQSCPFSWSPRTRDHQRVGHVRESAIHPALTFVGSESQTIGGFGRSDRFSYGQRFGGPGEVAARVLLEAGTAGGREPTANVELRSYLSQSRQDNGLSVGAEDEGSFPMRLLHFRRTFVEKMFAIHSKLELLKRDGQALGTFARHYYDLFQLAAQTEVIAMLKSAEYTTIKVDYDQISRAHFPRSYFHTDDMRFAKSDALFPPANLVEIITAEYDAQCRMLCCGRYPSWAEVWTRFLEFRELL